MAIYIDEQKKLFTLSTNNTSYQMMADKYLVLNHLYYGENIGQEDMSYLLDYQDRGFSGNPYEAGNERDYSLDSRPQEYSTNGARGAYLKKDTMIHIGETYGKSPAQIGLRWLVQKGISAIPKSVNPERIAENADIFDFELTDMEMKTIDALDEKFRSAGIPEDMQGFVI